jgi:hypothetical protein
LLQIGTKKKRQRKQAEQTNGAAIVLKAPLTLLGSENNSFGVAILLVSFKI